MRALDRALRDFIADHRAGVAGDPLAYVRRAPPAQRAELIELLDGFLSRAPRRDVDPAAFRGSSAARTTDELARALGGESGLWPAVLPGLRHRAGLRRGELVARLAAALGVDGREQKVGDYYHAMEQGRLRSAGVSDRVLEALGAILAEPAEALRTAGAALSPHAGSGAAPAFARAATGDPVTDSTPAAAVPPTAAPDEIDRLFTQGTADAAG